MRQYVPQENSPNTEDGKLNNSLSIIDRLTENGIHHISRLCDKRERIAIENRDPQKMFNELTNCMEL